MGILPYFLPYSSQIPCLKLLGGGRLKRSWSHDSSQVFCCDARRDGPQKATVCLPWLHAGKAAIARRYRIEYWEYVPWSW